ncbi:MAG: YkgJ family cysteine cluster protein [Alysiella sp.]|uniref:YkgJ family cysteine cluster protein n=1 Tax=Alysiella sp. TaxID=1872483 RepID=UPI0026DC3280|nr:YkgJ family cysteine cluster protein [Alysiella sp.]MDO4434208.1 YkgJ family cysteine cluster protein [Alysiella sp.]
MKTFPCTACGLCCQKVHLSEQTAWLNRGDGVCRHYNEITRLCTIYDTRPLVCRVVDYYDVHLSNSVVWQDFVQINLAICQQLQAEKTFQAA